MRDAAQRRRQVERVLAGGAIAIAVAAAVTYVLKRPEPGIQPGATAAPQKGTGRGSSLNPKDIVEVVAADSIPAIDDPTFIEPEQATWLAAREPVITFENGGEARAYPLQIMTWHEIVNDVVADKPVLITFCPLCNTALAFERPTIEGNSTTFGVSGKLIHSNRALFPSTAPSMQPQSLAATGSSSPGRTSAGSSSSSDCVVGGLQSGLPGRSRA